MRHSILKKSLELLTLQFWNKKSEGHSLHKSKKVLDTPCLIKNHLTLTFKYE